MSLIEIHTTTKDVALFVVVFLLGTCVCAALTAAAYFALLAWSS